MAGLLEIRIKRIDAMLLLKVPDPLALFHFEFYCRIAGFFHSLRHFTIRHFEKVPLSLLITVAQKKGSKDDLQTYLILSSSA